MSVSDSEPADPDAGLRRLVAAEAPQTLDVEQITPDLLLAGAGLDRLALIVLATRIEDRWRVTVDCEQVQNALSYGQLLEMVRDVIQSS